MKKTYLAFFLGIFMAGVISCDPKSAGSGSSGEDQAQMGEESDDEKRSSPLERVESKISGKPFIVQYGSPSVKGREVWGDLVPYNVVWRTGANEATFVELSEEMMVEGKSLAAGKYSLFTIPKENSNWTVIFNSDWDLEHGHFQYDEKNDVLRVEVGPIWENSITEELLITIEDPGLVIRWEKLKLPIEIQ